MADVGHVLVNLIAIIIGIPLVIVAVYVIARIASIAHYKSKAEHERRLTRDILNGESNDAERK